MSSNSESLSGPNNSQMQFVSDASSKLTQYLQVCVIGLCNTGDVRFCRTIDDHAFCAMKTIHKWLIESKEDATVLSKQLNSLLLLSNPFILHTKDIFQDEKNIYVISEFCSGGNLYELLKEYGHINENWLKFIAVQLIIAISYLHEQNCLYRGLLCENVLIDCQGYISLTGFGNSLVNAHYPSFEIVGYAEYLSPEMLLNKGVDESYDWWLLGCLLYELSEGYPPFQGDTMTATLQKILIGKVQYDHCSTNLQNFINGLLVSEPENRMGRNISEMKNHEWMKDCAWNNIYSRTIPSPINRVCKSDDPTVFFPHFKEDILDEEGDDCHNDVFFQSIH